MAKEVKNKKKDTHPQSFSNTMVKGEQKMVSKKSFPFWIREGVTTFVTDGL